MANPCTIVVTGGAGFVGAHTVRALLGAGHRVTIIDKVAPQDAWRLHDILPHANLSYVHQDLRDGQAMDRFFAENDAPLSIIHLAATASVPLCETDRKDAFDNNTGVTLGLAENARKHGIKRFVFASSAAVYGNNEAACPLSENLRPAPISFYGYSKLASEGLLQTYAKDMSVTCLRYFNIYGPEQEETDYAGVMTRFLCNALEHKPDTIFGDGQQSRDFIFVGDIARINMRCALQDMAGTYNLCTGLETTVNDIHDRAQQAFGLDLPVIRQPHKDGDIYKSCGCNDALLAACPDFTPTPLDDGFATTAAYFKNKAAMQQAGRP